MLAPSVDVLIVSYNTRDLLRSCLASIERHRPDPALVRLSVSVLDNASRDGSADMVANEFPDVRLVRSATNLGFGAGTNRLCATSTAEYLMPLNSDTVWQQDIATPLLSVLRGDGAAAVVGPRLVWPGGRRQYSSQEFPSLQFELALALRGTKIDRFLWRWDADAVVRRVRQEGADDLTHPRPTDFLWATCWLLRASDLGGRPLFDPAFPMYDEDLDVCLTLARRRRTVVYVPEVELVHLGGASSTPQAKLALMRRARFRLYRRHRGVSYAMAYLVSGRVIGLAKATRRRLGRRAAPA